MDTRLSFPADIPALRALWSLAFGDDGAYVDNFFHTYYRPDRVLVLEEEGQVRSMTAWFDTVFVVPGRGKFRAAYLYAVATHPDCRGKGLAARLLKGADEYFRTLSIPAVTTVPAEPSLHSFFGANGFRECFVHQSQVSQLNAERPAPLSRRPSPWRRCPRPATALCGRSCWRIFPIFFIPRTLSPIRPAAVPWAAAGSTGLIPPMVPPCCVWSGPARRRPW